MKLGSLRKMGWRAMRHRNTSCMATVFLNVARYSLKQATQCHAEEIYNLASCAPSIFKKIRIPLPPLSAPLYGLSIVFFQRGKQNIP